MAADMADEVRIVGIVSLLVFADDARNLEQVDLLHDQHVEKAVVRLCIRHGVEAAAVPAAVEDTD